MKSMTGFGKQSITNDRYQLDVEVKSVNHRFLDIQIRMPREYNEMEISLRNLIKKTIGRGRLEIVIYIKKTGGDTKELSVNWHLLDSLLTQLNEAKITRYHGLTFDPQEMMSGLINHPDFFEISKKDSQDDDLLDCFLEGMSQALAKLNASRQVEGEHIKAVLLAYLADFTSYVTEIQKVASVFEADYQTKLESKLTELLAETALDESRLLTEVALLIERGDIHEELDRLAIHIKKMATLLDEENSVGRELDFLIQEMNREVNTIGSKSAPIEIKEAVVKMKTILEKIREQVQNIE